ncbi:TetR/AcrR family transcriptional regulator [Rathayibacter toxicus]|uniref:TetR/AcrR family transcriptional regulator n=1 Tax=Rathayibacter toxicus TaxID=145458 RepID=A0A0C5BIL5_9MICO|nr:TetR/AcrR family transcriptional regulator [Rathayibacter toxicus]AJM78135.1 hypothetical protein TI83_09705 [Rathayibacter toxicus]ALS57602.1 hypothetical protein APU90_07360 [Rathayibacter toxicus]KKM44956.1 hypothetical protein VT73_07525 [Rathayibacter toxicus]PPG20726.1 TetR/AcrR family transcriptional regulator [Rathayibacter toxicus]PPH21773.1 TetR/AcrR family transcriptional regulator [Rathayibacter toxicus]
MSDQHDGRRLRFEHRRSEILDAATAHVLEHGVQALSLRKLAQSANISHATLLHHFRTRDELVAEIIDQVLARVLAVPEAAVESTDALRFLWGLVMADHGLVPIRVFLEITGMSMFGSEQVRDAVARSISDRISIVTAALLRAGCPVHEADALAVSIVAMLRGLVSDLLVTGEVERVTAAFEDFYTVFRARSLAWEQ